MSVRIDVSEAEQVLLVDVLSDRLKALREEVSHTDNRAFRKGLELDEDKLKELIGRISNAGLSTSRLTDTEISAA